MLATWAVGQVLWSLIWLTLFVIWAYFVIAVFRDVIRSHDMGGVAKALWVLIVILLPYVGVFVYVIVRGGSMAERYAYDQHTVWHVSPGEAQHGPSMGQMAP